MAVSQHQLQILDDCDMPDNDTAGWFLICTFIVSVLHSDLCVRALYTVVDTKRFAEVSPLIIVLIIPHHIMGETFGIYEVETKTIRAFTDINTSQ